MTDGCALLMAMNYTLKAMGQWQQARQSNLLDGGAHFYDSYACSDGKWLAVGPIEPQFYALLLQRCGIDDARFARQWDRAQWPALKAALAAVFATRTRDEWCAIFDGSDACITPVLDMDEAPAHPTTAPATPTSSAAASPSPLPPRASRAPRPRSAREPFADNARDTRSVLLDWGIGQARIDALGAAGVI